MEQLIKVLPNFKKFNSYIEDVKKGVDSIMLSGLTDSGKVHFAYATHFYSEKPICIITYNEMQAKKILKDLKLYNDNVVYFPKKEILGFDYLAESKDYAYKRMDALNDICNNESKLIVTTVEAATQKLIDKELLYSNSIDFKVQDLYNLDELKEKLVNLGYERYDIAEARGQFSIRGGIVDIGISEKTGVRIEFWGDEIDSIRYFDLNTQRSTEMLTDIKLYPANEFVSGVEANSNLINYLNKDYIIVLDEISKIKARLENINKDTQNIVKTLLEKGKEVPETLKSLQDYLEFTQSTKQNQTIYLEKQDIGFVDKKSMHAKRNGYSFSYREANFFRSSMDLLFEELQKAVAEQKTIIVLGGNETNCKKIYNLLSEKINSKIVLKGNSIEQGTIYIEEGSISNGFECYDFNLLILSVEEIFDMPHKKRVLKSNFKQAESVIYSDLKIGDYVVHKVNGIGAFVGVDTVKADGIIKDYIKIRYKNDSILYVPINSMDSVRKYIGAGDGAPKLNTLGGREWANTKSKVKSNLKEVAKELIELYAKRSKLKGFAFSKDTPWQVEFEEAFPYEETNDQLRCIEELKKDMEKENPMDRILCGDVGYGKTEVALRGAFKSCMDQKQVAYLVPTTILANQQYETFKERMKDFPITIELLNRFKTKKEQEEIIKKLKLGTVDIVIGTHRLLSNDVEFKDLGLLIIDEEHRFGVKHKEKIKELKTNVDVFTMTATPIPRTLHMSIIGVRDMSVIYEPPKDRKSVQTYVLEYDEEIVKEAITKELEREGQVFYLYNNVEGIERKALEISNLLPEANVAFAHGQMTGRQLEDIMISFINKEIDVIVCTTILESGIDIPNANTIIVENADRLGLAQLYQIRGRVGRSGRQAYAYIMYKRDKLLTEVAEKRLVAIKEFTEFGSGFKIAMRDLEIRGAGSLLGELQHGHMDQVGYDMYCKLLEESVKEMQGEQIEEEIDVQIDIDVSSYISDKFIENSNQKIEIYQEIALCKTEDDIINVTDEILDRYGIMPKEVETLLEVTRIKQKCRQKQIAKILQKDLNLVFEFIPTKFDMSIVDGLIKEFKNRIKFSPSQKPYITYKMNEKADVINEINLFLKSI
ncbi:MAG: transcription-repair coupling factor [Lachnospiraceae bacterium]|nr:transcription-repair coupling factor [Lachnospiraceae bacterium]